MYCKNCGNKIPKNQNDNYCHYCGEEINNKNNNKKINILNYPKSSKKIFLKNKLPILLFIIFFIVLGIIGNIDNKSIKLNDEGIEELTKGNYNVAIEKLNESLEKSHSDENKLNILMNTGYAYYSNLNDKKALEMFKKALVYTKPNTIERYLANAEISLLEKKPKKAEENYLLALKIDPNDFSANSNLSLFYLDLNDQNPDFFNPKKGLKYSKIALDNSSYETREIQKQNVAIAYFFNDDFKKTIDILSESKTIDNKDVKLWLGMAYINMPLISEVPNKRSKEYEKKGYSILKELIDSKYELPDEIINLVTTYYENN